MPKRRKSQGRKVSAKRRRIMGRRAGVGKTSGAPKRGRAGIKKGATLEKYMGASGSRRSWLVMKTFPQAIQTSLTYYPDQTAYTLSVAGSLGYKEVIYRVNAPFDPEAAAGGFQPRAYDQYALLYKKYGVKSMDFAFKCTNSTSTGSLVIGHYVTPDATPLVNTGLSAQDFWEVLSNLKARSGARWWGINAGQGSKVGSVKGTVNTRGVQKDADVDDITSAVTTQPTKQAFLHLFIASPANVAATVQVYTRLKYNMVFFDRQVLADA